MKKIFYLMAMAIVTVAFTACSDNETTNFVINNGQPEVSINRLGGMVEIPVTASGDWTATISGNEKDELPWSDLRQTKGNGSAKLVVDVDYLDPTLQIQNRKAQVTVKSGDETQVITVRQYIGLSDGETADNTSDFYGDLWHNKGIGKGFNPVTGEMTSNFVLNIDNVIALAETNDDYATLFAQEPRPGMTVDATLNDTLESNLDSLGVHCQINVKFAKFKLGLEVDYHNGAEIVEHMATYTGSQDLEYLKSTTSTADIAAILENAWDDDNKKWVGDDTLSQKVVSIGFRTAWANVMKFRDDETNFHKAIDQILKNYGPLFVDGATLGGSIFTAIEYDSLSVSEDFKVGGKVTADVALAAITISGNVSANYAKAGQDIWKSSHFFCSVSGGDQNSYYSLLQQLNFPQPDTEALTNAAQEWMKSIKSSNDKNEDNTAIISVQYTGIWNLFPFYVAYDIKDYIISCYKDTNLCVNLDDMGIASTKKTN